MARSVSADDERVMMPGLAAQPIVTFLVGFALFGFSELGIAVGVLFAMVGTTITACVAYPLLRRCIRRGRLTARRTVGYGAALGNIPAALGAALAIRATGDLAAILTVTRAAIAGTIVGTISAAVFWVLSGRTLSKNIGAAPCFYFVVVAAGSIFSSAESFSSVST